MTDDTWFENDEFQVEVERLRAALIAIRDKAYSPQGDDHIWMDDSTTLGLFIDMTLGNGS